MRFKICALCLMLIALQEAASACLVCVPRPTPTLADRLLRSAAVILAQADPQDPSQFTLQEILAGEPGSAPIRLGA